MLSAVHAQIVVRDVEEARLGEKADGFQSLAPGAVGQMSRTTRFGTGLLFGQVFKAPGLQVDARVVVLTRGRGLAERTSPVVRSST